MNLHMEQNNLSILNSNNWLRNGSAIHYVATVKPYSQKELCDLYAISNKTFRSWITPFIEIIGEKRGAYYTVLQVEVIFLKLGIPYHIKE